MIHDVAIQNLPVIFALDRAGLVGADGPTHHGVFDLTYLQAIPNMTVCAPKDGNELRNLLYTALKIAEGPFAVRYPKDCSLKYEPQLKAELLNIGSWENLKDGQDVVLLAVGAMVENSLKAREILIESDIFAGVVNCRFIKPFDIKMMKTLAREYSRVITIEENTLLGGFGSNLRNWCADNVKIKGSFHTLGIPDDFVVHGSRNQLLEDVGLSPEKIADYVLNLMGKNAKSSELKELVK